MTAASPPVAAAQMTTAYEALRAAALSGRSNGQIGLAILIHRGLAAWLRAIKQDAPPAMPAPAVHSAAPATSPTELTRVLAGIIVALTTGDAHA